VNQAERRKFKELEKRVIVLENQIQAQSFEKLQQNMKSVDREKIIESEHSRPETLRYAVWAP